MTDCCSAFLFHFHWKNPVWILPHTVYNRTTYKCRSKAFNGCIYSFGDVQETWRNAPAQTVTHDVMHMNGRDQPQPATRQWGQDTEPEAFSKLGKGVVQQQVLVLQLKNALYCHKILSKAYNTAWQKVRGEHNHTANCTPTPRYFQAMMTGFLWMFVEIKSQVLDGWS